MVLQLGSESFLESQESGFALSGDQKSKYFGATKSTTYGEISIAKEIILTACSKSLESL
jgi:hypothetical protein